MSKTGVFCTGEAPSYAHEGDAGADIRANVTVTLAPGERKLVGTGVRMALPDGVVAMVCSRSGLAHKNGVMVVNSPGIVDSGYRGEVMINLINLGTEPFTVEPGDRVAQLVITPFVSVHFLPVEEEFFTSVESFDGRGTSGHGSSGIK
jgi:dUTP pyrophosphatase